eukprot:15644440-Heterocapsa_arctica.AAC.1
MAERPQLVVMFLIDQNVQLKENASKSGLLLVNIVNGLTSMVIDMVIVKGPSAVTAIFGGNEAVVSRLLEE